MRVEKLFHVLVVAGASSTAGLAGCSSDGTGGGTGPVSSSGGASSSGGGGGAPATGGSSASGGNGGAADACASKCQLSPESADWTDCNGCCCWLPIGTPSPVGAPTCGNEPCCVGRGR